MSEPSIAFSEPYYCTEVGQLVRVSGLRDSRAGAGDEEPCAEMTRCSKAHVCGKFATPSAFLSARPVGCPYHDRLMAPHRLAEA